MTEREQAEADKETEEESEVAIASAELKPGERKVISDGEEGPVVEIIKRTKPSTEADSETVEDAEGKADDASVETEESGE